MLQLGFGGFGAAGVCVLLLIYRSIRKQWAVVETVRESLLAFQAGESSVERLAIDPSLGLEAAGWNKLLEERKAAERVSVVNRVNEKTADRRNGRGDMRNACDSLAQGIILIDENLRVNFANGAAASLVKRRRTELNETPISELITDPKVLESIDAVAKQGLKRAITLEIESGTDPYTVFKYSVRPVRSEDKAAATIVIEDITQQRIADRSRNAFINQVTHELRTPLTNIRLYVETAIEEVHQNPASVEKSLNVINSESRRLERIVSEMLSMAEIEAGCMKLKADDVRFETLFEELRSDYQAQADDKRIKLQFNLPPKFPVITGDRDRIVLALHNLVGNALKYTMPGGTVTIAADIRDGKFVIDVADTGIGIKSDELERVFERFYRAHDPRVENITGTGLGLTLAREVLRMHGGDVVAESQLDKGSTFSATIPLRKEAA